MTDDQLYVLLWLLAAVCGLGFLITLLYFAWSSDMTIAAKAALSFLLVGVTSGTLASAIRGG